MVTSQLNVGTLLRDIAAAASSERSAPIADGLQPATAIPSGLSLSALIGVLVAALVVFDLHAQFDAAWLGTWFSGVAVAHALRVALARWHHRLSSPQLWHSVAACVAGCAWGALPFLLPAGQVSPGFMMALLIGVVAVEALAAPGVDARLTLIFGVPILFGQAAHFLFFNESQALPVSLAWLLAACITLAFARGVRALRLAQRQRTRALAALAAEREVLFEAADRAVLSTRDGVVVACNAAAATLFGYDRAQLPGQSLSGLYSLGPTGQIEWRHFNGRVLDVEVQRRRYEGADDVPVELLLFADVSVRRRLEGEVAAWQERMQNAIETLPSGLWDYETRTGRFYYSGRFKAILGYANEVDTETPLWQRLFFHHDLIHAEDRARVAEARMDFLQSGTPFDQQYRLNTPDNRRIWVHETARVLQDAEGQPQRYSGTIADVSAINAMQEQIVSSEQFHKHLIEASNSLIWRADEEGVLTYVNDLGARELYGYEAAELIGRPLISLCAPETEREILPRLGVERAEQAEPVRNLEMVHLNKAGRRVYVSVNAVPVRDEVTGRFAGTMGINTDITWLKRRERAFQDAVRMQRLIFDSAGEGIVMIRNGRVHRANQAFADLVGATIGDIVARPLGGWFEDPAGWEVVERQLVELGNVIKVEQHLLRADGRKLWAAVTGRVAGVGDEGKNYIWVFADISARKEQEEQSWYRANHDELTGLPNRRLLQDRFEQSLVRAKRESMRMGVLMLDLDGFKQINDIHGHNAGDEVLRQVARRLSDNVRQLDTVARLGGDEFVIVLHQVNSGADAEQMAMRLIEQVRLPIDFAGKPLTVSTSVGVSLYPEGGETIAALMHTADMAMYAAKASGKNAFKLAQPATGKPPKQPIVRQKV